MVDVVIANPPLFQFHIGAIRSMFIHFLLPRSVWFQFHIGAIRSVVSFSV